MRKKRGLRIVATVLALLLLMPCAGCFKDKEIVNDKLNPPVVQPQKYDDAIKKELGEKLHTAILEALLQKQGEAVANVWKQDKNAKEMLIKFGDSFEGRGVLEKDYKALIDEICEDMQGLLTMVSKASFGEGIAAWFGAFANKIGVEKSALLLYDFTLLYAQYQWKNFRDKYILHPEYSYLQAEANSWNMRIVGIKAIGEENFSSLLRFWLSYLSVFSTRVEEGESGKDIVAAMQAGDIALFLREQGKVLGNLTLTKENYAFVIELGGEVFGIELFGAMVKAKKHTEYAMYANELVGGVSTALSNAKADVGELIIKKEIYAACKELFETLTQEQKEVFTKILSIENDEATYTAYLQERNLKKAFEEYKTKERGEWEERIYNHSPQLAFLVLGR